MVHQINSPVAILTGGHLLFIKIFIISQKKPVSMTQAIDNSNLKRMGIEGTPIDVFTPAIKLEFGMFPVDPEDEESAEFFGVKVTDQTVYVGGDGPKIIHIALYHEDTGAEIREQITETGDEGAKIIDLSNFGGGLRVTAFVVTNQHFKADGSMKFSRQENNLPSVGRIVMLDHWSKRGGSEF
jgi:hypothetical protein